VDEITSISLNENLELIKKKNITWFWFSRSMVLFCAIIHIAMLRRSNSPDTLSLIYSGTKQPLHDHNYLWICKHKFGILLLNSTSCSIKARFSWGWGTRNQASVSNCDWSLLTDAILFSILLIEFRMLGFLLGVMWRRNRKRRIGKVVWGNVLFFLILFPFLPSLDPI